MCRKKPTALIFLGTEKLRQNICRLICYKDFLPTSNYSAMKCLIPVLALFCLLVLETQACCKNKKVGQCCGNGKCNIFCCNCNGGCNKQCETDCEFLSLKGKIGFSGNSFIAAGSAIIHGRKKREVNESKNQYSSL